MFKTKYLCAILIATLYCATSHAAVNKFELDSGQADVFALAVGTSGKTARLDEGTGLDIGVYTIRESDFVSAGLTAGKYTLRILHGDYTNPSASVAQTAEFTVNGYAWSGTAEVDEIGDGSAAALSAAADAGTLTGRLSNARANKLDNLDNLDVPVSEAAGSGSFTESERSLILASLSIGTSTGFPSNRTFTIKRQDGKMQAVAAVPKDVDEEIEVLADFRAVLKTGDAIKPADQGGIVSITLIDDGHEETIDSTAFDDVDNAELWMNAGVKFHITGGVAGQNDRVRVKVLTVDGDTLSAPCTVKVGGN